jgi:hypothetical protein
MVHWILGEAIHRKVGPMQNQENTTTKLIKVPLAPSYVIKPWCGGFHSRPQESLQKHPKKGLGLTTKPLNPWRVDCLNHVQTKVSVRKGIM